MVVYQDALVTDILAGKDTLTPVLTRAMNVGKQLGALKARGFDIAPDLQKANVQLAKFPMALDAMNVGMKESIARAKELQTRFDMNILSWVFGGMALQRMGLTILRFVIPSMEKLGQLNDYAAKRILGVYAAWEFLKISIFETLMGIPGVQDFIKGIVDWLIRLAEWAQTHPEAVELIAKVGAAMAVLGTIAIGVGIFGQLEHMVVLLGSIVEKVGLTKERLSGLVLPALGIYLVYKGFQKAITAEEFWKDIGLVAIGGFALAGPWGAGAGILLKLAFDLIDQESYFSGKIEELNNFIQGEIKKLKEKLKLEQEELDFFKPNVPSWARNIPVVGDLWAGWEAMKLPDKEWTGTLDKVWGPASQENVKFMTGEIYKLNERFKETDYSLVGGSLVPSLNSLNESILVNVDNIPLMTGEIILAKQAIDSIPDHTTKIVEIKTIHTNDGGGSDADKETVGSVTGGGTLTSKGRIGTVWRSA